MSSTVQTRPSLTPFQDAQKQELLKLIRELSVFHGDFTLASGKKASWYLDCRLTSLSGRGSYLLGHVLWDLIAPCHVDAVGGMALGAAPLVTAVTYRSAEMGAPIPGFLVRKGSKGHGRQKQIEGHLAPWMRIALVEDVVTTGKSTLEAVEVIRQEFPTVEIVQIVAVVDRLEGGGEALKALGIPYQSLYTAPECLGE